MQFALTELSSNERGFSQKEWKMERRDFLRSGVASTALATQRILGANDRVRVALIGAGGRGRGVTSYVAKVAGAEIAGVSDVYLPRR